MTENIVKKLLGAVLVYGERVEPRVLEEEEADGKCC
jgi:hypothetical protein